MNPITTLTAVFTLAPEGGYASTFRELPEVFSKGDTREEARINLFNALDLVLAYHRDQSPEPSGPVVLEGFSFNFV